MKLSSYLIGTLQIAAAIVVGAILLLALVWSQFARVYFPAHLPPAAQRAFVPEWTCSGRQSFCERTGPAPQPLFNSGQAKRP
jgi:hypothetical protein